MDYWLEIIEGLPLMLGADCRWESVAVVGVHYRIIDFRIKVYFCGSFIPPI
jgi:hypothetical protein